MKKTLSIIFVTIFLFASVSFAADATYSAGVYHKAGGDEEVVASGGQITVESGGEIEVESGGIIDVESGGYFKLAGTAVTATGAQLNFLSGVTAGTSASSKAVVLSASGKIDTIDMTAWKINGTPVTATAANLNAVPTATGTGLEIDAMTKNVYSSASTITLGAGGAVTQAAAIQLKDADGNAIAAVQKIRVYVSDDAAGATPATSGCNGAVTVSVGATLKVQTEKLDWDLVTDANGAVTLTFDNTGGGGAYTKYVVVVLPNGKVLVSAALNVATA